MDTGLVTVNAASLPSDISRTGHINNRLPDLSGDVDKGFNRWRIEMATETCSSLVHMDAIREPIALPCPVNVGVESYLTRHRSIGEMHLAPHSIANITSDVKPFTARQVSNHFEDPVFQFPTHCCGSTWRSSQAFCGRVEYAR